MAPTAPGLLVLIAPQLEFELNELVRVESGLGAVVSVSASAWELSLYSVAAMIVFAVITTESVSSLARQRSSPFPFLYPASASQTATRPSPLLLCISSSSSFYFLPRQWGTLELRYLYYCACRCQTNLHHRYSFPQRRDSLIQDAAQTMRTYAKRRVSELHLYRC